MRDAVAVGTCVVSSEGDIQQRVVECESVVMRFPDVSMAAPIPLSPDYGGGDFPKIVVLEKHFEIAPNSMYVHLGDVSAGPFVITNTVNVDPASVEWSVDSGTMTPAAGASSTLLLDQPPTENDPIVITAEAEFDEVFSAEDTTFVWLCSPHGLLLQSSTTNFSPHLGETSTFSLDVPGCEHDPEEGWIEAELMRETTSGWQHVGWLDASQAEPGHQKRRRCLFGPQTIAWDGIATESAALADSPDVFTEGSAPPVILSVYDNEWHIPTNMPATCGAPERVYVGFDHAKVNTRSLPRLTVGDLDEDVTEHCLGVVWESGGSIDIFSLLGSNYLPYKDDLTFTTTGLSVDGNGVLTFGGKPEIYSPDVCLVTLIYGFPSTILDHLWIVINAPAAQTKFDTWVERNSNTVWTTTLPKPYSSIAVVSGTPQDPEPGAPRLWGTPHAIDSYLHHDAKFEMRSVPVGEAGHGHQATYDTNGVLIADAIAAGTADIFAPYDAHGILRPKTTHREEDVLPFIEALQLDGNPVRPNRVSVPKHLNRPCIYKGQRTEQYISKRPILPTGTQPGVP